MKNFRYVWYQKSELKLTDFLHIGGEEKDENSMALDGNGQYILPASGIAGAVRAYLSGIFSNAEDYLGKQEERKSLESRVYYYDALCRNVRIESRKGIEIDPVTATAAGGKIYTLHTIGEGMQTELQIQAFLETKEQCQELSSFFEQMLSGIQKGHLTFGAKKSIGGGRFQVVKTGSRILDMKNESNLYEYLSGAEEVFRQISCEDYKMQQNDEQCDGVTEFRLIAEIKDGLIVKSGERDAVNMRKSIGGESCYYIPGSTIKGAVRGYGEKIAKTLGIPEALMTELFGGELEKKKYRSHIKTQDTEMKSETIDKMIYNRIKIDRWLGSVIEGAKTNQEVLSTKPGETVEICIQTDMREEEKQKLLNGLVFLAMRDIGLELIPIGSGSGVGFGRLTGKTLVIDGKELSFSKENKGLIFRERDAELKQTIGSWLSEVKRCREN